MNIEIKRRCQRQQPMFETVRTKDSACEIRKVDKASIYDVYEKEKHILSFGIYENKEYSPIFQNSKYKVTELSYGANLIPQKLECVKKFNEIKTVSGVVEFLGKIIPVMIEHDIFSKGTEHLDKLNAKEIIAKAYDDLKASDTQ